MKKSIRIGICLLFTWLCLLPDTMAQNAKKTMEKASTEDKAQLLPSYIQKYMDFTQGYTQEKVYLHFDNTSYFIGENIWFKAYVIFAENHHYTNMSKTLYVELLSQDGNLVNSLKLKIENGQTHGVFYLKDDLSPGFYEIRAYTRCMLNFGQDVVFSRVFPVMDKPSYHKKTGELLVPSMTPKKSALPVKRPEEKTAKKNSILVDFYPEGGHLIEDIANNVAFKTYLPDNPEAMFSGRIYNQNKDIVSIFSITHDNMGIFEFTPVKGEQYTCRCQYDGKEYECTLPLIQPVGYALKVNNLPPLETEIYVIPSHIEHDDTIALAITCRGKVYAYKAFKIEATGGIVYRFSKKALPSGVNQAILYNAAGDIIAERMFFIKNPLYDPKQVSIKYAQDKSTYLPFEPINLKLNVSEQKDSLRQPLECTFSMSIKDAEDKVTVKNNHDIYSELLLASDLKGYINNPPYYFEKEDSRHLRALDMLMMVQGWSRYDWDVMTGKKVFELRHPIEEGVLLQGKVLSIIRRIPQKDIKVTMWMTSDSSAYYGSCQTDSDGSFNFLFDFDNQWNLSLQITDGKKRKNFYITIDRQFSPQPKTLSPYETQPPVYKAKEEDKKGRLYTNNEIDRSDIKIMPGDVLLPEAEVKGKKRGQEIPVDVSITYNASEEMDKLEDLAESTYNEIPLFLSQINPNFWLRYDTSGSEVLYYRSAPVVFCDVRTRRVVDANSEDMPIVDQVEKFEIVEPGVSHSLITILGGDMPDIHQGMKNVAYVLIYRYADGHRDIDPVGIRHTVLQGYHQVKEFYHPHYDKILLPDQSDHRRTLYWNPDVKTNSAGVADIRFYNNSTGKQISVDAEVLTSDGKIGSLK